MRSKYLVFCIFIIIVSLLITQSYSSSGYSSPEKALNNTNSPPKKILEQVEVADGVFLFYEEEDQVVGASLIRKKSNKWIRGFGDLLQPYSTDQAVTGTWVNIDHLPAAGDGYQLFWGIVHDPNITKVEIKYIGDRKIDGEVYMFDTPYGYKVWYLISNKYYGSMPGLDITGFNDLGEPIFESH